jgi:hypothetical protein
MDYKVTTIQSFPYSNNYDLYENSKGDMWVLASNGLYVVSSEEMLANGRIETVHYDIENGLPYMATANSFSELTAEGNLYIASSRGVVKVNIEEPFEDVKDLPLWYSGILIPSVLLPVNPDKMPAKPLCLLHRILRFFRLAVAEMDEG